MAEAPARPGAIALYLEHVQDECLRACFAPGSCVLELGAPRSGTAARLRAAGVQVASAPGPLPRLEAGELAERGYEGAYLMEAGEPLDTSEALAGLGRILRAGAPVVLRITPRRGRGPREVRQALGPDFAWSGARALGLLVPPESRSDWAERYPLIFGLLAALEGVVRRWPVLRSRGRVVLLEGRRR